MMQKYVLVGCFTLFGISGSVGALTRVEAEKIFDLTNCVTLWQNTFLALFGDKMHKQHPIGSGMTTNYRDPAVVLGNALQLPRDILGAALEEDKMYLGQALQAVAIARLADDKMTSAALLSLFDTAVFNSVNAMVKKCCPAAALETVRRLARIVNMAMVRYGVLLFVQGIMNSTRSAQDNAQSIAHTDFLHSQASQCFWSKTLYHLFVEGAGAVVAGMIDDTAAGNEQIVEAAVIAAIDAESSAA